MFEELSFKHFVIHARDLLDENSSYTGNFRYNRDKDVLINILNYIANRMEEQDLSINKDLFKTIISVLKNKDNISNMNEIAILSLSDTCYDLFDDYINHLNNTYEYETYDDFARNTNMSDNLLRLFGNFSNIFSSKIVWDVPNTPGLNNSLPIIYTTNNKSSKSKEIKKEIFKNTKKNKKVVYMKNNDREFDQDDNVSNNDYEESIPDKDYIIKTSLSPSLKKILNMKSSFDSSNNKSDWKPPSFSGLRNSSPIIKTSTNSKVEKLNKNKMKVNDKANSYQNNIYEDNNSNYDNDSNNDYEESIPDKDYIIKTSLSPSLKKILNMKSSFDSSNNKSDWKPPSFSGLRNSSPIIRTGKNSFIDTSPTINNDSKYHKKTTTTTPTKSDIVDNNSSNDSDNDNNNDEDDDDEEDMDFDDFLSNNNKTGANMSESLMKALGLDTSHITKLETDWKPPTQTGLEYSKPLIQTQHNIGTKQNIIQVPTETNNDDVNEGTDDDDDDVSMEDNISITSDYIPKGSMSLSLMQALGLDTSQIEKVSDIDWKAPERSGLQYSTPIIPKK